MVSRELRDALKVICGVQWSEVEARMIADTFGLSLSHTQWLQWLEALLRGIPEDSEAEQGARLCGAASADESGVPEATVARHAQHICKQPGANTCLERQLHTPMVDVFAALHGTAQGRFTCWNQYKNQRYSNVGARIDYTIVDRALFDSVVRPDEPRLSGLPALATIPPAAYESDGDPRPLSPYSEAAAHLAATSGGRWQPAAFTGVGLEQGREDWYSLCSNNNGIMPTAVFRPRSCVLLLDMKRAPADSLAKLALI